ncbi:MAG: cyclic nucleotide-binding domain-containing protein [Chloroflexi bacterium]|nr:cyclic nucleotide-binding domain-containing protein [Chloroflexota bacterium]
MISPELLRRYPFFGRLSNTHLKAIAMLTEETSYEAGDTIFEIGQPANRFHFLMRGGVDLHYIVTDMDNFSLRKDFFVGQINLGEPFGISALIEPYCYTATALANSLCHVLEIEAAGLRTLCDADAELAAVLMRHLAQVAMSRLHETRIQLMAARA